MKLLHRRIFFSLLIVVAFGGFLHAQENDIRSEYRFTVNPFHPITGNLIGFGYLGYVTNPDAEVKSLYLGYPGVTYKPEKWLELWGGLIYIHNFNENTENTYELRPFTGFKLFYPNSNKINLYNFTRLEYRRITKTESDTVNDFTRIRSRFGVEFPISANAWQIKSYYGLADIEPYYRFDSDFVDLMRVRAGLGYILNERVRVEFIYHLQLNRSDPSDPLRFNSNIFRFNFKIATTRRLLRRLGTQDWSDADAE